MKIKRMELRNFRCFPVEWMGASRIDGTAGFTSGRIVDFHPRLTVIVAQNGQGKTAILDALRIGLWPFLSSFDLAKSHSTVLANGISVEDVRVLKMPSGEMARQLPCEIVLQADYGSAEQTWTRARHKELKSTKTIDGNGVKQLKAFATQLQARTRNAQEADSTQLPILAYYGTGRLWAQKRLMEAKKSSSKSKDTKAIFIRSFGYLDCMDPASTYRHFKDWFIQITEANFDEMMKLMQANQAPSNRDQLSSYVPIRVVQDAIDCFLRAATGWHSLEYAKASKDLVLHHDQQGEIPVDQLSDGIRSVLAMIGDIAYRCYQLNPALGAAAAKMATGVVLIDEVDMHLHPKWQQVIVSQLQEAFPNIQFVVTTHSPQVLSTVPKECIRIIRDDWSIQSTLNQTQGVESNLVLKQTMGTDPLPKVQIATDLNRYIELIEQGVFHTPEVTELRMKVYSHFGAEDLRLSSAEALARFKFPDTYSQV